MAGHPDIRAAYRHCRVRATAHYENFPVASWLLPARLRGPVAAIYCFARDADDLADEDQRPVDERRADLVAMQERVQILEDPAAESEPEWIALADARQRFGLPAAPFVDLVDAFIQDLEQTRYATFGEVVEYCRRSANPVGRLMLYLDGNPTEEMIGYSDAVCSALQLINFYQDLHQDLTENDRIYLPQDEMAQYGVSEETIAAGQTTFQLRNLMQFQYARADRLLRAGAPLGGMLRGRMGLEIRAIINGGARVLWRLRQQDDVFARPRLRARDAWVILAHSLRPRRRKRNAD
ncbi:squalene synthase HpnC [Thioalkalivibrio sp. K90mix]|uniref:squalene synthase HpnC n=1 Tax=Thioalkalivibrio sp. (strain K90mix) TaxID=396595 RepID=UPI000195A6FD|nr:squalene synthase HpnC [Thioalkalivibrio sp. K90mix]ADC72014.1 squalene synthase HpnC [Thioalkalivibrio sp. K90mix]